MVAFTPLFGILEFEKDPLRYGKIGSYVITWLQDAGGFAAVGLLFWTMYVMLTPKPAVVGSRRTLISKFMVVAGLLALGLYLGALGVNIVQSMGEEVVEDQGNPQQAAASKQETPEDRTQNYLLAAAGFFALLGFLEPFLIDLFNFRWRRIYAIAKLSFKEAVRNRVIWVFFGLLLVFLFPASWFFKQKPEDRLKVIVDITSTAMLLLLIVPAMLLSGFSIPTDVKNQTIHTIVTKPVERFEIVVGRFFGYMGILTLALFGQTAVSYLLIVTQNIEEEAKRESMKARSTEYGHLSFRRGGVEIQGIDVGREYGYRKYLPGNDTEGNPFRAVWSFGERVKGMQHERPLACEFAFDVYRTLKGVENKGVKCTFFFSTWQFDVRKRAEYEKKARAEVGSRWNQVTPPNPDEEDPEQQRRWDAINRLAEEYGYFVLTDIEVVDYHTLSLMIPPGLLKNAKNGTPTQDNPSVIMTRDDGLERLRVSVRCESPGQFIGAAPYDLYLLESEGSFLVNFFKGALGIWFLLCIATALAAVTSTYLAGVISAILSAFIFILGYFQEFLQTLATGTNVGGGPFESLTRLVRGDTGAAELPSTPTLQVLLAADSAYRWILRRIFNVLPDPDRFSWSNHVAQGFNIPRELMVVNFLFLVGYLLPWFILAYYLMRSREVAG